MTPDLKQEILYSGGVAQDRYSCAPLTPRGSGPMPEPTTITRTLDWEGLTLKVEIEQTYGPPEEGFPHGTLESSEIVSIEVEQWSPSAEQDILATLGENAA